MKKTNNYSSRQWTRNTWNVELSSQLRIQNKNNAKLSHLGNAYMVHHQNPLIQAQPLAGMYLVLGGPDNSGSFTTTMCLELICCKFKRHFGNLV